MSSNLHKFTAVQVDELIDPDEEAKRLEKEKQQKNKSGYDRPYINTEAIWEEVTRSFQPQQPGYGLFRQLFQQNAAVGNDGQSIKSQHHQDVNIAVDSTESTTSHSTALVLSPSHEPIQQEKPIPHGSHYGDVHVDDDDEDNELQPDEVAILDKYDLTITSEQMKAY